jgi:hypothetical protein
MKKIAGYFLVVIALLSIAYFFIVDIAIKALIEREGSAALRAKLDITSATFHLLPTSLTLRGVQATNPQRPSTNLLQADVITLPLTLSELLERKLIVDTLQIHGLRFAQARTHSGAIDGLTPAPIATTTSALPDPQQLQQQKSDQQHSELQRTQQDIGALRDEWRQRLRTLPTSAQLSDYQFRAQSRDAANRARLRSELNDELTNVRKLQQQFTLDFERVQPGLNYSAQSTNTVQLATGAPPSITGGLLGHEFKPLLGQLLGLISTAPETAESDPAQWQLLARSVVLDGEIDLGATPLYFTGVVDNVTPQPRHFDVITRFDLQGKPEQPGKFSASGNIDKRKLPQQNVRFDLSGFPITQLPLSSDVKLQITVTTATVDIQGLLALTGNQLDINMLARFHKAVLQVIPGDNAFSRAAAETLLSAHDFDLNFRASGNVNNPTLKLNSSLDTSLATAIARELNAASSNAAQPAALPAELAAVRALGAELQQMQQTLLATQATLQTLLEH